MTPESGAGSLSPRTGSMTEQLLALASLAGGEPHTLLPKAPFLGDIALVGRIRVNRYFQFVETGKSSGYGDSAYGSGTGNTREFAVSGTIDTSDASNKWRWDEERGKWANRAEGE